MIGTDRLERELTAWFADTAAPRTPDYTADILELTAAMRQRPRWSFPARWLPASIVEGLPPLTVPRARWRTFALLAVLGLLFAAALAAYVGSRPRLPAPFGLAANGLVAYGEDGDIWTVDPRTGERRAIVTGQVHDRAPRWSRDGTRVAFLRGRGDAQLVITNADGSGTGVSKGPPFRAADTDSIAWSPDGKWVALAADAILGRSIYLIDTSTGAVRNLETSDIDMEMYWRPPDGRQLIYVVGRANPRRLMLVSVADGIEREVPLTAPLAAIRPGGWTPDGRRFVVHRYDQASAWTDLVDPETGQVERLDIGFGRLSNDGAHVVGHRGSPGGEPILCVLALPAGPCVQIATGGLLPDWEHTAGLHWSPDDRWIVVYPQDERGWVLLDPDGGPPITPAWSERGIESWQRVMP